MVYLWIYWNVKIAIYVKYTNLAHNNGKNIANRTCFDSIKHKRSIRQFGKRNRHSTHTSHSVCIQITFHLIKCQLHRSNSLEHHSGLTFNTYYYNTYTVCVTHCSITWKSIYKFFLRFLLSFGRDFYFLSLNKSLAPIYSSNATFIEMRTAHAYIDIIANVSVYFFSLCLCQQI